MCAVLEIVLAILSGVGLLELVWILFGHLLIPAGSGSGIAAIPGRGDGENLEQAVMGFLWLRGCGLFRGNVVIVDVGLSETGRALACALGQRESGVLICHSDNLGELFQGV